MCCFIFKHRHKEVYKKSKEPFLIQVRLIINVSHTDKVDIS